MKQQRNGDGCLKPPQTRFLISFIYKYALSVLLAATAASNTTTTHNTWLHLFTDVYTSLWCYLNNHDLKVYCSEIGNQMY